MESSLIRCRVCRNLFEEKDIAYGHVCYRCESIVEDARDMRAEMARGRGMAEEMEGGEDE